MKKLSIIFLFGLFLASCNNDKPSVIVNLNIIGENSDSIQKLVKDAVNNDSTRVVNINIYNNVNIEPNNRKTENNRKIDLKTLLEELNKEECDTIRPASEWNW